MEHDEGRHYGDDDIQRDLTSIKRSLARIERKMSAEFDTLEAAIAAEGTSLDAISAGITADTQLITDLQAQIAGGLSAAEATSVNNDLGAISTRMAAVAALFTPTPPAP